MYNLTLSELREIAISRQIPDWGKLSEHQLIIALASQDRAKYVNRIADIYPAIARPTQVQSITVQEGAV